MFKIRGTVAEIPLHLRGVSVARTASNEIKSWILGLDMDDQTQYRVLVVEVDNKTLATIRSSLSKAKFDKRFRGMEWVTRAEDIDKDKVVLYIERVI